MIHLTKRPGQKVIELGGGSNPSQITDVNVDVRPHAGKVHFTCDFNQFPYPISTDEWDIVLSIFCIEHLSYVNTQNFVNECFRICKPGGQAIVVMPNTEAQSRWIIDHPEGWDGKSFFESASCKLFGDQQHGEREGDQNYQIDSHKAYFNPMVAFELFQKAGFESIIIEPFGERGTDLSIQATKPNAPVAQMPKERHVDGTTAVEVGGTLVAVPNEPSPKANTSVLQYNGPNVASLSSEERAKLFDRNYFNGSVYRPWYWDYPNHQITANRVLMRKPESVIELGAARGYIVKRLQDAGVRTQGIDISRHCYLSQVADVLLGDVLGRIWNVVAASDLMFSIDFLDRIPEEKLPELIDKMQKYSKRGLHGLDFGVDPNNDLDRARCTIRPIQWWRERLPKEQEIVDKSELENGQLPDEVLVGDGKIKLNIGSGMTQFHWGWENLDALDFKQFAEQCKYKFRQHDAREGLPYSTGTVAYIYSAHFLEHLTYKEAMSFLRESRRVLCPTGAMRLILPDAQLLMDDYYRQDGGADLNHFDELNENCEKAKSAAEKMWALLHEGHQSCWDAESLCEALIETGFTPEHNRFRQSKHKQILKETLDVLGSLSLYVDAVPTLV